MVGTRERVGTLPILLEFLDKKSLLIDAGCIVSLSEGKSFITIWNTFYFNHKYSQNYQILLKQPFNCLELSSDTVISCD